jgi:hypothetical protein
MGSDAVSTSRSMRAFEFYGPAFAHWLQEQNKGRPIRWEKVDPRDEQILPPREQRELDALPSGLNRKRRDCVRTLVRSVGRRSPR